MNPINKVRYNNGTLEPLCFNKGNISIGMSSDYMINDAYAESCFTGWYQSMDSSGSTGIFDNYVVLSNKSPGGSMNFSDDDDITINDPSGFLNLDCNDFTLEFWIYVDGSTLSSPIITNTNKNDTSGYRIDVTTDAGNNTVSFDLYLGSSAGSWDIYANSTGGIFVFDTWYHVCLSRSGDDFKLSVNGSWILNTNNSSCITDRTKVIIGGYIDNKGINNFSITNIRYYIGRAKYDLNSNFTPPSYPISAIGKITNIDSTPLLFNAFQNSKLLYNSGQRSFTIQNTGVQWRSETPFLYDIPEIYNFKQGNTTTFINNLRNIAVNMGDNVNFTTVSGATDWYLSKNNIFIQNFNYENIPTSGLTYLYDPEHIMSLPGSPFSPTGSTGTSVYNLIDNTTTTWEIYSPAAYKSALVTDGGFLYMNNLPITSEFTVITIFNAVSSTFLNAKTCLPGVTGNTANGFQFMSFKDGEKGLDFILFDSSSNPTVILPNFTGYTLTNYNMFTITSNGSNNHRVYVNNTGFEPNTSTINRTSSNININWGSTIDGGLEDIQFKLFMVYNRELTETDVSNIYDKLRNRIGM